MKLNLPNKITIARIILSIVMIIILLIPWYDLGVKIPEYIVNGEILSLKYIISGIIFLVASLTDFVDGYLARSRNMVTDFGKVADAIADKILVNGLLIILAYDRLIPILIPVVIITRDIIVDSCKMISGNKGKVVAASWLGKAKTMCMMIGLTLVLFNNIPFTFINIPVDSFLLLIATLLSVISGCQYYYNTREFLFPNDSKN
ncbi:MAG: CDP-diacylglycerol--glycerol-3-phosphate 3-phosphatidyltransferase [Clostridiales bacterium]|nr:CDP-diacylglycerol--glycerol-3-phosphate 3-phosphatidyltransferase [Clostridiales bacterium]